MLVVVMELVIDVVLQEAQCGEGRRDIKWKGRGGGYLETSTVVVLGDIKREFRVI